MRSFILLDSQVWDPIHHVSGYEDRSYVVEQYQLISKTADEGTNYDEASDFDNIEKVYRRLWDTKKPLSCVISSSDMLSVRSSCSTKLPLAPSPCSPCCRPIL